jgi:hypothetical protein
MRLISPALMVTITLGLLEASFASIINHPRMLLLDNKRAGEEDRSIARRSASTDANTRASARPFFSGKTHRIRTALSLPAISMILDNVQQISKTVIPRVRSSSHVGPATIFLSCLFGYNKLIRNHNQRSASTSTSTSTKMNAYQIIGRSVRFWIQAAPIILHYQFIKAYILLARRQQRRDEIYQSLHETYAPRTLSLILQMRGIFIKFGQVLSSRPDFVPSQYIDLLQTLQDNVPPLDEGKIIDIVRDSLWKDHGLELGEVFERGQFEGVIGTASIGQVHKATLTEDFFQRVIDATSTGEPTTTRTCTSGEDNLNHDGDYDKVADAYIGGRVVAVKVMLPDAEDRFRNDFNILKVRLRVRVRGWCTCVEVEPDQIRSDQIRSDQIRSDQIRSDQIRSDQIKSDQIRSDQQRW